MWLFFGLCSLTCAALWALALRGYLLLACVLLLPLTALLWHLHGSPCEGLELAWRGGRWYLVRAGRWSEVEPARRAVLTPWVVHLVMRAGSRGPQTHIRVFKDSVTAHEWRLLRTRLRLLQEESG